MNHRFTLERYRSPASRHTCPECGRRKVFSRYVDMETNAYIADDVGRCSREDKCAYHYTPAQYFSKHGLPKPSGHAYQTLSYQAFEPSYLPQSLIRATVTKYHQNNFVQFLAGKFGYDVAYEQAWLYLLGTSKHWPGASIFWQVDGEGRVRTGKIMLYNAATGKRVKEPFNHIGWAHKLLRKSASPKEATSGFRLSDFRTSQLPDFNLKQCLFGEHLLQYYPNKPVAICESEKTAIISSVYFPEMVWLASGSLQGLNADKCKCLRGRKVILVPDLNAYDKWEQKRLQLLMAVPTATFMILNLLENNANETERHEGWDVADYL